MESTLPSLVSIGSVLGIWESTYHRDRRPSVAKSNGRKTDGIDDNGCLKQATGLVAVCGKLAARADDADQAEDKGEYPPGTSTKAMSLADDGSNNERGEEDDELEDGDASSCVELHCAWVYSNEDLK